MKPVIPSVLVLAACGPNLTPEPTADPPLALDCLPNLDGKIAIDEIRIATNAKGSYWVSAPDTPVDVVGTAESDGTKRWDWSVVAPSDELVAVETSSLEGAWFAPMFPGGELVAPLNIGHTVVGIMVRDAQSLSLLGIASTIENPPEGKTLVVYDAPIPLYLFPIVTGARWSSVGKITTGHGTIDGLPFIGENRYDVSVDAIGELDLPEVTFTQVHRVTTHVTVQPSSGPSVSRRSVSFMFECFGEVARATSRDGEPVTDFRVAQEVRRLGIP
ncbi:MAG TPA: hypothetical protein VIV40_42425 [Kofleriaceae bacterium]